MPYIPSNKDPQTASRSLNPLMRVPQIGVQTEHAIAFRDSRSTQIFGPGGSWATLIYWSLNNGTTVVSSSASPSPYNVSINTFSNVVNQDLPGSYSPNPENPSLGPGLAALPLSIQVDNTTAAATTAVFNTLYIYVALTNPAANVWRPSADVNQGSSAVLNLTEQRIGENINSNYATPIAAGSVPTLNFFTFPAASTSVPIVTIEDATALTSFPVAGYTPSTWRTIPGNNQTDPHLQGSTIWGIEVSLGTANVKLNAPTSATYAPLIVNLQLTGQYAYF